MEQLWYVVGFAFAGVSFVFLTIGAAWLVSHRNRGDVHKGLFFRGASALPFGAQIRPVRELIDYMMTGRRTPAALQSSPA